MEDEYKPEKWVWTEKDFGQMGWHDCPVYAIRFEDNVLFDIDYILQWNYPGQEGIPFTYYIAPATLVFIKPTHFKIDIESHFINELEIVQLLKEKPEGGKTVWNIMTRQGEILIRAERYKQIIRRPPAFQFSQAVPPDERGGISFCLIPEKDYRFDEKIITRRKKENELYALALKKRALILKKDQLDKEHLGPKQYLVNKRQLEKEILSISKILENTRFEHY